MRPNQFTNITPDAFYAIVGALVIQQKAAWAWVANLITRQEILKETSGGTFRKKVTYTVNAYTRPRWTLITHPRVPIPNARHVGFQTLYGDQFKLGFAAWVRNQGVDARLPQSEVLSYSYSESESAWTGFAMFVFSFAIAALSFGAFSWLSGLGASGSAGGVAAGSTGSMIGGAGLGATAANMALAGLAGGAVNAAWNYAQGVGFTDAANRVFATGEDPLAIDTLGGGFDWRKGVQQKMIGSDPDEDILATPGDTGKLFQELSLEHKDYFASGLTLQPLDDVEMLNDLDQTLQEAYKWLQGTSLPTLPGTTP